MSVHNGGGEISGGRKKNKNLQSQPSQIATCTPKHPSGFLTSDTAKREGHAAGMCQGWRALQLLCIKQSLGAPVLSSNPCLQPLSTNIYVHVGPGINGGNSLAYQGKPLSKF